MTVGETRALLFDFGGTLDADGARWAVRFHDAYQALGGELTLERFEPIFKRTDKALETDPATRSRGFRSMIQTQAGLIVAACPDGARVSAGEIADRFYRQSVAVVDRNRPILGRLAGHARLGVVSNFTGNLDRCLAELGLLDCFGFVADSSVVGIEKPHPGIFTLALNALAADGTRSWMIGDNYEADIRPALGLGLSACWLTAADRAAPEGPRPTARISTLLELEPVLRTATCTD